MESEYFGPKFIVQMLPPKNLTKEQKVAVVRIILCYCGNNLLNFSDSSENTVNVPAP